MLDLSPDEVASKASRDNLPSGSYSSSVEANNAMGNPSNPHNLKLLMPVKLRGLPTFSYRSMLSRYNSRGLNFAGQID